jgi:hypothetical protein
MTPVLRHGILEERRQKLSPTVSGALLLESEGYHTKVFEFLFPPNTPQKM